MSTKFEICCLCHCSQMYALCAHHDCCWKLFPVHVITLLQVLCPDMHNPIRGAL